MTKRLASIDMGTHTVRLLVADVGAQGNLRPILRERIYDHLGEAYDQAEGLLPETVLPGLRDTFRGLCALAREHGAREIRAVATGVLRTARNREDILRRLQEDTGVRVRPIPGHEEATLTARGVFSTRPEPDTPYLVFDLGGGSTEFVWVKNGETAVYSLPIGAALLTKRYLERDPPGPPAMDTLSRAVANVLRGSMGTPWAIHTLIGTGGTVASLGAMALGISLEAISMDTVGGLVLEKGILCRLARLMQGLPLSERVLLKGLDPDRGRVILAGAEAVLQILELCRVPSLIVSLSDLLEGILLETPKGEKYAE